MGLWAGPALGLLLAVVLVAVDLAQQKRLLINYTDRVFETIYPQALAALVEGDQDLAESVAQSSLTAPLIVASAVRDGQDQLVGRVARHSASQSGWLARALFGRQLTPRRGITSTDTKSVIGSLSLELDANLAAMPFIWRSLWVLFGFPMAGALIAGAVLARFPRRMAHLAYHDALTGLPNQSYLFERLEEELRRAHRHQYFGALLFIDVDQFQQVNESFGRQVGDCVLKQLAECLLEVTRDEDIVIRFGADEFVVVLTFLDKDSTRAVIKAEDIAEKIRDHVSQARRYQELELRVRCSIGVVLFPEQDAGIDELLRYMDAVLYQAKLEGRNRICFFNNRMSDAVRNTLIMEGDLRKALERQEFVLHFQPRVNVQTGEIVGAEALLRWQHPERGLVPPEQFIPILESSEMIVEVGLWVIQNACVQLRQWLDAGTWTKPMTLGVNISPRQFRSVGFAEKVIQAAEQAHLEMSLLEMEITESMAIQGLDETLSILSQLKRYGVRFSLDDFGTGYSSISYLKRLPVSALKIDQSFVRDMQHDRNDRVLVETIVAMGNLLGLDVVAEGVESQEQLSLLSQYGCGYYQGYLASKPLPAALFAELLSNK